MSSKDNGASYYKVQKNTTNAVFTNVANDVTICITKQNYIPIIYSYKATSGIISHNAIEKIEINRNGNINVSTDLADNVQDAVVYISSQNGVERKSFNVSAGNSVVSSVGNIVDKGLYTVSLFVNGQLADSKSVIVK